MKKTSEILIDIIILCVILVVVSIYTLNNNNNSKSKTPVENTTKGKSDTTKVDTDNTNTTEIKPNVIKSKAPDFKLKDLDGKELSLSDLKGKKVYLNFCETWSEPSIEELPEIQKLYQQTKDTDLVIVAVGIGESLKTVKAFVDANKYTFKVLLDSDQSVTAKYNITSIPTSYFIDVDGNIISKISGPLNIEQMRSYIKTLDKK